MDGTPAGGADGRDFKDATPFPTDGAFDCLLRAAVRFSNALARHDASASTHPAADAAGSKQPDGCPFPTSPLSPLTASSSGSPDGLPRAVPTPDEVREALNDFLSALSRAGELKDSLDLGSGSSSPDGSSCDAYSSDNEDGRASACNDPAPEDDVPLGGKRKRRGRRGGQTKTAARNNGQDDRRNAKKEYDKKKRAKRRKKERIASAQAPPYERRHKKSFYRNTHGVRLLNLRTFEVTYATGPGGYIGKKKFGKKVYSVAELKKMGFVELEWDGDDTILILDREGRIVCVLVGRPQGLTLAERQEWDAGVADLARAFEEERVSHEQEFGRNLRGDFAAFAAGFTMGPGSKQPTNLNRDGAAHREIAERLLAHGQLRRLAGFASEAVAHYFPLAFLHVRDRLAALCKEDPTLEFPFGGISLYPACTFNLGPYSVCFGHTDGSNYPGFPCTVSPFGSYNPALGGHFILFDFRIYFKFPQGTTVALSSAGLRHGNTRLAPGDKRYGFTQYLSGAMIRYVSYGFRLVKGISDEERARVDAEMGEGWEAQLARFSTWSSVLVDRKRLYDHERGRC